jgi:uncharacterized spore protein YtfJ
MTKHATQPTKIDQQLAGPQITVGGRTVQPLARLTGQQNSGEPATGGAGAWVRLSPTAVIVRESDGSERRIAVTDPTGQVMRALIAAAAFVATISALLIAITRLTGRRDQYQEA